MCLYYCTTTRFFFSIYCGCRWFPPQNTSNETIRLCPDESITTDGKKEEIL